MSYESRIYTPQEAAQRLRASSILEEYWDDIMTVHMEDAAAMHAFQALIIIARGKEARDFYQLYKTLGGTQSIHHIEKDLESML